MRVLFLATRDWDNPAAAGGDIQLWEWARFLASRGHTVTFLASRFPGARKEETLDGINVVRLGGVLSLWFRTFWYYVRHCRGRYDVVVAEGFGGSRIPRFSPLYVREPIITEWHQLHGALFGAQYPKLLVPLLNLVERLTARAHRNTLVHAFTQEWHEAFPTIGFKHENIFVLPCTIREEWLDGTEPAQVTAPTLLWLGKFRRYKCPHDAVLSTKLVAEQIPEVRLILAGRHDDGKYERQLKALVEHLDLEQHVEFRFDIVEERKRRLLKTCRALILPSAVEGFGIVVLEANACGTPVIASSRVPGSVVQQNHNGLRYPFGDTAALARSIIAILEDDELYGRLSANSVAFAKQFAWASVGARFERVLELAIAGRRGNGCSISAVGSQSDHHQRNHRRR